MASRHVAPLERRSLAFKYKYPEGMESRVCLPFQMNSLYWY